MNDIKASLAFGTALIFVALWLMRWHCRVWKEHAADETNDDRARRHYRRQFRRRIQVSVLVFLLGVLIPVGDWLMTNAQRKHPQWIALFWIAVLALTMWIMILALFDWLSTRMHVRATRAALGTLARKQRELEAELERLRNRDSNGRH